jgi:hypothetical protein
MEWKAEEPRFAVPNDRNHPVIVLLDADIESGLLPELNPIL